MCGADVGTLREELGVWGSPPRVRSRLSGLTCNDGSSGITSACAEQTASPHSSAAGTQDHLRVCGADVLVALFKLLIMGSPPRVRSRRRVPLGFRPTRGITSACAEQTAAAESASSAAEDHLRVCGADSLDANRGALMEGSPPRVRSRLRHLLFRMLFRGITSACAEQTTTRSFSTNTMTDHLRVCGAD